VSDVAAIIAVLAALLGLWIGRRALKAHRLAEDRLLASQAELRSEAERLSAVITTQQLIATTSGDLAGVMRLITERVPALTGAAGAGIALRDGYEVVVQAGSGTAAAQVGLRMGLTSSLVGRCFQRGELLVCDDAEAEPPTDAAALHQLGGRSAILVPLWDGGAVTGVLLATSPEPRRFAEREVRTLQLVAGLLSASLARATAFEAREAALLALQDSEERYRTALAALHEGIALIGADGAVQPVNDSAERLLAPLRQDGLPLNIFERPWPVLKEDGSPWGEDELPLMVTLCTGRPMTGAILGVPGTAPGQTVWLSVNCQPLWRDDQPLPHAVGASFTDITARRRAERELQEARVELERRVRERTADLGLLNDMLAAELKERRRTEEELRQAHDELEMRVHERTADLILVNRSLQEAKDAAELANTTKSRFLATMSHELRTPLNSVIGFANVLLKNKDGRLGPQELTYLTRIHDNGRHLLGLINDILDLSKIEAGRVELARTPVDLATLVGDLLHQLGDHLLKPSVRLAAEVPPGLLPLETDPIRLKQVLLNLIGNALKFTDAGSVVVRVTGDPDTRRPRAIEVRDTGIGIPAERHAAVFEAFQQADDTTERRYGGTGLGLAISRSLLQAMGHRLTVASTVGVGSVFTIELAETPAAARTGRRRAERAG
jgi:signal transduction histidine kinase/putative methionine-R-sulfoxide reductase with GAF domain